jgi:5-methylcytosine-specific restriction endonuclease McrA
MIISQSSARAKGLKRYFTGKPCRRGHIAERYTNGGACAACDRARRPKKFPDHVPMTPEEKKEKHRLESREYRKQNLEKVLAYQADYRSKTRQAACERSAQWRRDNPDRYLQSIKRSVQKNPALYRFIWRLARLRYRIRQLSASGSFTAAQIAVLLQAQNYLCAGCQASIRNKYSIDHIHALSNGGSNDISNIQLLCKPCNSSKGAKGMHEWLLTRALHAAK